MSNEIVQINADKISKMTNYSAEEVAIIKNTVAKGTTDTELAFFLNICKSVQLNPFVKEIWCYKDKKNNLLTFAGRDGFLAHAQKQKSYAGIRSCEVRKNDTFKIDIANNKIQHEFGLESRGDIVGAYAIAFRKDGEPTIEWAQFDVYNKGYNTWNTHPSEMIKKVAETHALKKAFGLSGIQSEYDFEVKNQVAIPINTEFVDEDPVIKDYINKLMIGLDEYVGKDKENLKVECSKAIMHDKFSVKFAEDMAKKIGLKL